MDWYVANMATVETLRKSNKNAGLKIRHFCYNVLFDVKTI
ncbi:hypothetical protein MuYL_1912 [Mucilaginibacter xinganensis]|uniref:Uncharacterized protein n=1 Tax=Mucilaginibacter xinganensis TaxID=1234841 RepID=A0A223NW33_9SPHI|nr:hypothetical protein MuYL_1912 [Mucilaginibacter xinganensis]